MCELRSVESVSIQPLCLSTETVLEVGNATPITRDFLSIAQLEIAFGLMLKTGKPHDCKKSVMPPLKVKGEVLFVSDNPTLRAHHRVVCSICQLAMVISKDAYTDADMQRAMRCHFAAHLLQHPEAISTNYPCPFCLSTCHATVKVKKRNLTAHVTSGVAIAPKTAVLPNCSTYGDVLGREIAYKFFKPVKNFACTNKPVYCKLCEDFVWSYNLKNHYYHVHDKMDVPASNMGHLPTNEEKNKIINGFPINMQRLQQGEILEC